MSSIENVLDMEYKGDGLERDLGKAAKKELSTLSYLLGDSIYRYIHHFIHESDETVEFQLDALVRLREFMQNLGPDPSADKYQWNKEKFALLLELIRHPVDRIPKEITSFLQQEHYGWQSNGLYRTHTHCFNHGADHCRHSRRFNRNEHDTVKQLMNALKRIFGSSFYGKLTTHLFAYFLSASFASRLNVLEIYKPYPILVSCARGSNVLKLIEVIATICDINLFPGGQCPKENNNAATACMKNASTYAPSSSVTKDMERLMTVRDVPVLISDFGCDKDCSALLNTIANLPLQTEPFGESSRFNVMPIFISDKVHSGPDTVYIYDLRDTEIDEGYIALIKEIAQWLGRWVYDTIHSETYLDVSPEVDHYEGIRALPLNKDRLREEIYQYINPKISLCLDDAKLNLSRQDALNAGVLAFFFDKFVQEVKDSFMMDDEWGGAFGDIHACFSNFSEYAYNTLLEVYGAQDTGRTTDISIEGDEFDEVQRNGIQRRGQRLRERVIDAYEAYGVGIKLVRGGSRYTNDRFIFKVELKPGTRTQQIEDSASDVGRYMGIRDFRAHISPDSIDLIIPNRPVVSSDLMPMLRSPEFLNSEAEVPYAVGYNDYGKLIVVDVAKFPHMWICGTSGSGKSSALHSLLMSIVVCQPIDKVRLLLMDFGASDLDIFQNVPHMLTPGEVIDQPNRAYTILRQLYQLMNNREEQQRQVHDVVEQQTLVNGWGRIVCVIDEFPALANDKSFGDKCIELLEQILARGRKQKINIILVSQSAKKLAVKLSSTNIDARIALRCSDQYESKAVLGGAKAERLCDVGSMYIKAEGLDTEFVRGSYMAPLDIYQYLQNDLPWLADGNFKEVVLPDIEDCSIAALPGDEDSHDSLGSEDKPSEDDKLHTIVSHIVSNNISRMSGNYLKKNFHVAYDTAKHILDTLAELGIAEPSEIPKQPHTIDLEAAKQFLKNVDSLEQETVSF